ncbi:MAG: hypothetical protein U1E65_19055 [Myxococcota bacterium]
MANDTWVGSPMGHAVRDPVYLAAIDVAEVDLPGVGDLCLRCHAPEAWLALRCIPSDGSRILPTDSGITCSACHRMVDTYGRDGQFLVADDDVMRGPWGNAIPDHPTARSDFLSSSRLCSTCHNLVNPFMPRRDPADGSRMGIYFSEQTTYSEWLASDYALPGGRSCIDCHMERDQGPVATTGPSRSDRSNHLLSGSNVFLLDAMKTLEPGLGLSAALEQGKAATRETLKKAASLQLVQPPGSLARGQEAELVLRVTNLSGHKLPTGYPEQQVFVSLHSTALGLDRGGLDPVSREPKDPLETYRTVQGQHDVGPSPHLALCDTVFSDNRIPPLGMVSTTTIAPVGKNYPEATPGHLAHWDDVRFSVRVPCDFVGGDVDLELGLYHLSLPQHYVNYLEGVTPASTPRGQRLRAAWSAAPAQPEEIAILRVRIPVQGQSCADAGTLTDAALEPPDAGGGAEDARVADAGTAPHSGGCSCARLRDRLDFWAFLLLVAPGVPLRLARGRMRALGRTR